MLEADAHPIPLRTDLRREGPRAAVRQSVALGIERTDFDLIEEQLQELLLVGGRHQIHQPLELDEIPADQAGIQDPPPTMVDVHLELLDERPELLLLLAEFLQLRAEVRPEIVLRLDDLDDPADASC
ncbi:MAG TPA: hypothetical protein PKA49_10415 [Tepidiformaceae bacterium]|nr:hypothetical protein [Tepidiformaceae bacterium]